MDTIQVKAGMSSELKFNVSVEGTTASVTEIRLSITTDALKIGYQGQYKNGAATFEVVDLEKFVKSGQAYDLQMEVFIGNQRFIPFTGKIEVVEPVKVNANLAAASSAETKVNVVPVQAECWDTENQTGGPPQRAVEIKPVMDRLFGRIFVIEKQKKVDPKSMQKRTIKDIANASLKRMLN